MDAETEKPKQLSVDEFVAKLAQCASPDEVESQLTEVYDPSTHTFRPLATVVGERGS